MDPARSLEQLEARVASLTGDAGRPLPSKQLSQSLQALAASLEPISHGGRLRMAKIAKRMAGVPVRSLGQSSLLKEAMPELLRTLVPLRAPSGNQREYHAALRAVSDAQEQLDELLLLDDQRGRVTQVFEAAANAVFLARGAEAPFESRTAAMGPPIAIGSFTEELSQARRDIGELAAMSLMGSRARSAQALASIADLVEAADGAHRLQKKVGQIRFQSQRVEKAARTELLRAGWLREALQAAVDALSELEGGRRSGWLDEAQRAVARIDPRSQTSFQRAAVQDALRATVDAFAALGDPDRVPASKSKE